MFKYLPASFLYTSRVSEHEQAELDKSYMPFVLQNSHKESKYATNVRTDYYDQTFEPWALFVDVMFRHFSNFAGDCLLSGGAHVVDMHPWFNYYATGGAMFHHSHPETDFGVIYCLRNTGKKKTLFNTFSHEYVSMELRYPKLESCMFNWDPDPGEYAFFPGSLFHATQISEFDGERITLIANILIKQVGDQQSLDLSLQFPPRKVVLRSI